MIRRKKVFYGWWIVAVSTVMRFITAGAFLYGFTAFFEPIRSTFQWTYTVTSIGFMLQRLESGIMGPVAGYLVDRVSPRKLMLFGWTMSGLGFILMGRINSLSMFYVSFLVIAIGMSFGSFVVTQTAVARWFSKKRSRALGIVAVGGGLSGFLVPLLEWAIRDIGWQNTLIYTGIGIWILTLPLCLVIRGDPRDYGYLPDGDPKADDSPSGERTVLYSHDQATGLSVKAALRTRAFWLLSLVFFFQQIGTSTLMVHIMPALGSVKIPSNIASYVVMGMTLTSLIGRLSFGFMGDFINKRYLMAVALILQAAGLFILSLVNVDSMWLAILFIIIYAPGYGGAYPLKPALQADYFGIRNFGTIMGLMAVVSMLAGLSSPVVAGWIFDVTGSYRLTWQIFALITLPAIPLVLLAKAPKAPVESD